MMTLLIRWFGGGANGLLVLALAVTLGLIVGSIRVRGVRLGVSAVLFVALVFGQFGWTIAPGALPFVRDFALVLFIYTIGLQVGPGFFSSFRDEGIKLNLLALAIVILGALLTAGVIVVGRYPRESASALYSGAFTTTPGFAAGEEALRAALRGRDREVSEVAGQAFTVTYPFGLIGPILAVILLRKLFGVRMEDELKALSEQALARNPPRVFRDIEVTSDQVIGKRLGEIPLLRRGGIILARLLRDGCVTIPNSTTEVARGDVFRAVGTAAALDGLVALFGRFSTQDLEQMPGEIELATLIVTNRHVLGRSLRELNLRARTGVVISRVFRAGTELEPQADFRLHFGDHVTAVGPRTAMKDVESELGNRSDALNRAELVPIFLGVALGILVGSIPLAIPGLGTNLKLGLAGGPMIVAILLSRLGKMGAVIWYLPDPAAQLLRDFGMAVFLACVGLQAGDHFVERVAASGITVAFWGAAITMLPPLVVCTFARLVLRMNFVTLSGLAAGGMTNSPALLFASEMTGSKSPALTYAAVYPLAMLVPIFCSQVLAIALVK